MKISLISIFLFIVASSNAQILLLSENMGNPVANPTAISAHTFQNQSILTYSGSLSEVRNTVQSNNPGASAAGNIHMPQNSYFLMEGINTVGIADAVLSFGQYKNNGAANNQLIVDVSANGSSWTQLTYSRTSMGTVWEYITTSGVIPQAANLRLRFTNPGSGYTFKIDDVRITGTPAINFANIESPASGTIVSGGNYVVSARVGANGYTYVDGAQAGIVGEIGYSSNNSDPSGVDWTWVPALYSVQVGVRDQYFLDLGGEIFFPGVYYYASRFSISGGGYSYGGYSGTGGGIWNGTTNKSGIMTVVDSQVVYANTQSPFTGSITALSSYVVSAQVNQPGLTDTPMQGAGVQAWIGYSTSNVNPSSPLWSWVAATYDPSEIGANDQYKADLGPFLNTNATYYYASRFQLGTGTYSYGAFHSDGVSPGNFWDGITYISGTVNVSGASTSTGYFRSRISGPWNNINTWESSIDNISWQISTRVPDQTSTKISIRNLHIVDISTNITADDIEVDLGGNLLISANTFTLNNGAAAVDMLVNGDFTNSGATFVKTGILSVAGKYNHVTSSLTLPIANWLPGSTCNITGLTNVAQVPLVNGGQIYHNFTLNNPDGQHLVSILGATFQVNGTLTLGPDAGSYLLLATTSGNYTRTINKIEVLSGQLTVSGSQSQVTLDVATDVIVSGGRLGLTGGSNGRATMNVGNNVTVTDYGVLSMIDSGNGQSPILNIGNDFTISGDEPVLEMESSPSAGAVSTINVAGDLVISSMSDVDPIIDFGYGTVLSNAINIAGDFLKTGDGIFTTSSANAAKGFVFTGSGVQNFTDTGIYTSHNVSYTVNAGAELKLNSNLTLGDGSRTPTSQFTVLGDGTLDFDTYSVIASDATSKFITVTTGPAVSTLKTANADGLGGTIAAGSLQNFLDIGTAATNGIRLQTGVNYVFNGNTTTPYPIPINSITNAGAITINADVQSNMNSQLSIIRGMTIMGGAKYTMNPLSAINDHRMNSPIPLLIMDNGIFDTGGENQVIRAGGAVVNINGEFITRDAQGFIGTSASLNGFNTLTTVLGPNSIVNYGLSGDQIVQGGTSPVYANVTFSGSGTKTLVSANNVTGTITVQDAAILDVANNTFGVGSANLTMTENSIYRTGGSGIKPDAGGTYSLSPGTKIDFYSPSVANTNPRKNSILYANVDITGNNIINTGVTGLRFQPGSTFTVKSGGIFRIENPDGFTGSISTAINNTNAPTIVLEPTSIIDYSFAGNQTITPHLPNYATLKISGSGIKSFAFTPEIKVGENLQVSSGTLQIDPNVTMNVNNAVLKTGGIIDIKDSGSLVQIVDVINATANNNIGDVKVQRNANDMYRYDFTYWSSPVTTGSNFTIFDLTPLTRYDKFFKWDAAVQNWTLILNGNENMLSGIGYIARAPDNFPTSPALTLPFSGLFEGVPNNGIVTVPIEGSSSVVIADYKFNLLGNPYPSAIFADTFSTVNANLGGTFYFWTHNTAASGTPDVNGQYYYSQADYATYNQSGGTAAAPSAATGGANTNIPTGKIASGQGFFIRGITDGASTATFNNSMRIAGQNGQFFRNATGVESAITTTIERHRIWLNLTNDVAGFSQNLTAYAEGATNGIDRLFDGDVLGQQNLSLYSIVDQTKLTSQGRELPFDVNDKVKLGYKSAVAGALHISLDHFDGLFEGQNIYVEDKLLNVIHDLKQSNYNFTSEIGVFDERFVLRYTTESLYVADFDANNFVVFVKDRAINVKSIGENIQKIAVFDQLGRRLFEANKINSGEFLIKDISMSQQVLIVKTTLESGVVESRKIVFQ